MSDRTTILFDSLDRQGLPLHLAFSTFSPGQPIRAHDHDFYEIFLVHAGRLRHQVNNTVRSIKKGDLIFLRPEDSHWFRNPDTQIPARVINVALPRSLVVHTARFLWDNTDRIPSAHRTMHLAPGTQKEIIGMAEKISAGNPAARSRLLTARLLELFAPYTTARTADIPAWLDTACEAMRKRENYRKGIRRFVALSGKTQEHLTRTMRAVLHTTPTAFINRIKAAEAARLLEREDMQVMDACLEAGFNNLSHFINTFKDIYGITPRQYRKVSTRVYNI